jgi:hypothetical protein
VAVVRAGCDGGVQGDRQGCGKVLGQDSGMDVMAGTPATLVAAGGSRAGSGSSGRASVAGVRSDAGVVRLTGRDVGGLVWCGEMYGVRSDLLACVLGCSGDVVRRVHVRWRRAGLAETGRLGPGPVWCWLTRAGLDACGLPYGAYRPPLGRLAHVHAAGCVRAALEDWDAWQAGGARWRGERRLRWHLGSAAGRRGHVPDGEVLWPEGAADFGGQVWCVEVELTPKTADRTAGIMTELLTRTADYGDSASVAPVPGAGLRYARVLYACAPAALGVVTRARALLPDHLAGRVDVRSLPGSAR